MTAKELTDATQAIKQAVCECMPTAAIASGWMSAVDVTPWVDAMCERFPFEVRPASYGLFDLHDWLAGQGVQCGAGHVKALADRWRKERMRQVAK